MRNICWIISLFSAFDLCLSIDSLHRHLNLLQAFSPFKTKPKMNQNKQLLTWQTSPSGYSSVSLLPYSAHTWTTYLSLRHHSISLPFAPQSLTIWFTLQRKLPSPDNFVFAASHVSEYLSSWRWLTLLLFLFFEILSSPEFSDHILSTLHCSGRPTLTFPASNSL